MDFATLCIILFSFLLTQERNRDARKFPLCMLNTSPICEIDEEIWQSGNDQIGDIIGEHEEEDKDPVPKVGSAHSVSFWLPLTSVGVRN